MLSRKTLISLLKETYYGHSKVHTLILVTTRIGLHALMFKKHISVIIIIIIIILYSPSLSLSLYRLFRI